MAFEAVKFFLSDHAALTRTLRRPLRGARLVLSHRGEGVGFSPLVLSFFIS